MKPGEKAVLGVAGMICVAAAYVGYVVYHAPPKLMPIYQVESVEASRGELVYRQNGCSGCHRIWRLGGSRGGALDGIGSRRSSEWLEKYLRAEDPQRMLPSTAKKVYRMPSFAFIDADDRHDLVAFLASLRKREPQADSTPDPVGS